MRVLWIANGINLILDPIFIFGFGPIPALEIEGAAFATTIGRGTGVLFQVWAFSVWKIGRYNMVFLIGVSLIYFTFSEFLMCLFTQDPTVISIGSEWLRILSYSYFVYGWWMVSVQAFNGAGDTVTPTKINFVFFWLIQIPLSYYLAIILNWQHSGVFRGVFISETSVGLFTLWLFTKGKWKTKVL